MYAGSLFTIAEVPDPHHRLVNQSRETRRFFEALTAINRLQVPGGIIYFSTFDRNRFYPIVYDMQIKFLKPAFTDVTVEVNIPEIQCRSDL